ncbi:hypothetical protein HMN09_00154800 [Mycena chlorophos]|uniref:Uncharacterized protein n=1 Tax=Mycena chlorophos TaxID=658473 RepID=A0A8H6WQD0_MYCCL|nr:hypothetical protein HMN09_00154800 [Mycena chlorophos]
MFCLSAAAVFTLIASTVSAVPLSTRQTTCPLQNLSELTVTAPNQGKVRWDMFTVSGGDVNAGDLVWFNNNQPNGNEVFTATVGSQPNFFLFTRAGGQSVGVSGTTAGSKLLASPSAATFQVTCQTCDGFATGNTQAAAGCVFELTDGTSPQGQCITFAGEDVVTLNNCDGDPSQSMDIFSH